MYPLFVPSVINEFVYEPENFSALDPPRGKKSARCGTFLRLRDKSEIKVCTFFNSILFLNQIRQGEKEEGKVTDQQQQLARERDR